MENIWLGWSVGKMAKWMDLRDCGMNASPPTGNLCQDPITVIANCQCDILTVPGAGTACGPANQDNELPANCEDFCFESCWEEAKDSFESFGTLTSVLTLLLALFQIAIFTMAIIL